MYLHLSPIRAPTNQPFIRHMPYTPARSNASTPTRKEHSMKTTTIIISILLAAAGAAQGQALTRDQVRAEVLAARAAGTLGSGGEGYQAQVFDTGSTLTRAEVRAQVLAARAAGTIVEGDAYPGTPPAAEPVTREQVRAELAAARAAGAVQGGESYPGPLEGRG
jgi:hypothetical protein